jgi:hypothetical protein
VALHYQDLDEAWVTRGWWLVPARGKVTTDDSKFDHVEGEPFPYEGPRSASFFRHRGDEGASDLELVFECPVEEPLPAGTPAPNPSRGSPQGEAPAR